MEEDAPLITVCPSNEVTKKKKKANERRREEQEERRGEERREGREENGKGERCIPRFSDQCLSTHLPQNEILRIQGCLLIPTILFPLLS